MVRLGQASFRRAPGRSLVPPSLIEMLTTSVLALVPVLALSPESPTPLTGEYVDASATTCAAGNGATTVPFCTITEAIAAAVDGDTIRISPGSERQSNPLESAGSRRIRASRGASSVFEGSSDRARPSVAPRASVPRGSSPLDVDRVGPVPFQAQMPATTALPP